METPKNKFTPHDHNPPVHNDNTGSRDTFGSNGDRPQQQATLGRLRRVFGGNRSKNRADTTEYEGGDRAEAVGVPGVCVGCHGDRPHGGKEKTAAAHRCRRANINDGLTHIAILEQDLDNSDKAVELTATKLRQALVWRVNFLQT